MGSFFIHALLFYGLSLTGGEPVPTSPSPIKRAVLRVDLVTSPPTEPAPEQMLVEPLSPPAESPVSSKDTLPAKTPDEAIESPTTDGVQTIPWVTADPKVKTLQELPFPPDTANMTAIIEIEVDIDKNGAPTAVKVLNESPKAIFTEWAWEMGMKGLYSPKVTATGPVASKLIIRLDVTPGAPLAIN